jgi:hypothetical protein
MVKGSVGKVSLAALRSCCYFLGENKKKQEGDFGPCARLLVSSRRDILEQIKY